MFEIIHWKLYWLCKRWKHSSLLGHNVVVTHASWNKVFFYHWKNPYYIIFLITKDFKWITLIWNRNGPKEQNANLQEKDMPLFWPVLRRLEKGGVIHINYNGPVLSKSVFWQFFKWPSIIVFYLNFSLSIQFSSQEY